MVTAILSLTLGIGATSAVFSVIYALLGNPYPYLGADRMIELNVINEKGQFRSVGVTGPQLSILRQAKCLESAAATGGGWNLTTTDEDLPEDVQSSQLSEMPAPTSESPPCSDAPSSRPMRRMGRTPNRWWCSVIRSGGGISIPTRR